MLDAMKAEKLGQQAAEGEANAGQNGEGPMAIMDEDARWELALRQKQDADRAEDKRMEKELIRNGIAKMKKLIEKEKKDKDRKKDKKHKKAISKSSKHKSKKHHKHHS